MLNQPISPWGHDADDGSSGWDTDRDPQFRLVLLWLLMLVPVIAIVARVAQLQLSLRDEFASAFSQTTDSIEDIPARDGRIQAADGTILADDFERYSIAVYYP